MGLITLEPNEEMLGFIRRRWVMEVPRLLFAALWICTPFFFFFPLLSLGLFGFVGFVILLLTGIMYAGKRYVMWHKSALLVTTGRVVDVDQVGLFRRRITEIRYPDIESVRLLDGGLFMKVFHTGSMHIATTEVHTCDIELLGIHRPEHVRDLILEVQCLHTIPDPHDTT